MEPDEIFTEHCDILDSNCAVNSLVLDYYKKFGRKRDLEQYFSLSTAQCEVGDRSGLFWRRMKSQYDSSDSGEKKSESPTELCRISISCSVPEPSTSFQASQEENRINIIEISESPPIINEDVPASVILPSEQELEGKSDAETSLKSVDATLDSINKHLSPTSSVTSQRKLEWDSLADVGYANETDRKKSASSLSTIERMALKHQYSNDTKIGLPTAHSTPHDGQNEAQTKSKTNNIGLIKRSTKLYQKDVDIMEFNVCPADEHNISSAAINFNLTKHISFNVENGGIKSNNYNISDKPEPSVSRKETIENKSNKEIQTSLLTQSDPDKIQMSNFNKMYGKYGVPVIINMNSLRRSKKKNVKTFRKQARTRKRSKRKKPVVNVLEKSVNQVSETESFEYMPGHMYNLNNQKQNDAKTKKNPIKSNHDSSSAITTESSKISDHSFTKDLEQSIALLKKVVEQRHEDSNLKKKVVKEIVQRFIESKYRSDDSPVQFLPAQNKNYTTTTTSTSDGNNSHLFRRPRKPILRKSKFDTNLVSAEAQSVPNLSALRKNLKFPYINYSNTESDASSKFKSSSEELVFKTSSEQLYLKYLQALKSEEVYKKRLKEKEMLLKEKLVRSDTAVQSKKIKESLQPHLTTSRLNNLIKDLARNNYDDGSGDGIKNIDVSNQSCVQGDLNSLNEHRNHAVFTLSSGNAAKSDHLDKKSNKKQAKEKQLKPEYDVRPGPSNFHCCNCQSHRLPVVDSSVQVNMNNEIPSQELVHDVKKSNNYSKDFQFVCFCKDGESALKDVPDNFFIYKCSRLNSQETCIPPLDIPSVEDICSTVTDFKEDRKAEYKEKVIKMPSNVIEKHKDCKKLDLGKSTQSSQTDTSLKLLDRKCAIGSVSSSAETCHNKSYMNSSLPVTQCIQTHISIHPKISDPSFSDINIISDNTKSSVDPINSNPEDSSDLNSLQAEANISPRSKISDLDQYFMGNEKVNIRKQPEKSSEKGKKLVNEFDIMSTIPVETEAGVQIPLDSHITLLMKINGKSESKAANENKECKVHHSIATDEIHYNNKATAPDECCNKSDQSHSYKVLCNKCNQTVNDQSTFNENGIPRKIYGPSISLPSSARSKAKHIEVHFLEQNNHKTEENRKPDEKNFIIDQKHTSTSVKPSNELFHAPSIDFGCGCGGKSNTYPLRAKESNKSTLLKKNDNTVCTLDKLSKVKNLCKVDKGDTEYSLGNTKNTETGSLFTTLDTSFLNMKDEYTSQENVPKKKTELVLNDKIKYDLIKKSKDANQERIGNSLSKNCDNIILCKSSAESSSANDPVMDLISDITKRYAKQDLEKKEKKKCFKEIMHLLKYLLDTDDSTETEILKTSDIARTEEQRTEASVKKNFVDKATQPQVSLSHRPKTKMYSDSSEIAISTDAPGTSTDSPRQVLNKIKRECEKYYQKHHTYKEKKCEISSSTSLSCERCINVCHCTCKLTHRCKKHKISKASEKKKCIAYNLIIQASDSFVTEEVTVDNRQPLKNIVLKVPSKKPCFQSEKLKPRETQPEVFKEVLSPKECKSSRSRSVPNESDASSFDEIKKLEEYLPVREYLEKNNPEFVERCSTRQHYLKMISESGAKQRHARQRLLSLQLEEKPTVKSISLSDIRRLAHHFGISTRKIIRAPKFTSEREMKEHSEKIYKTLPEVLQKKEQAKKDRMKKSNLIMASIFNKNLQKKALRGSVNISNYSPLIKI